MTTGRLEPGEARRDRAEIYERLVSASPVERAEIVFRLIEEDPGVPFELPVRGAARAILDGVDLSGAADRSMLRGANLRGASSRRAVLRGLDLERADLKGAALGEADLEGARLDEVNLEESDLAEADLEGASLGKAGLRGALLEETNLRGARLRFADLRGAGLEKADLRGADLWGADLQDAVLAGANLRDVVLKESNLRGVDLTGADLQGVELGKADLQEANLSNAMLQGVVLSSSRIDGVRWSGAWLDRTRMRREQIGTAIGEERAKAYEAAAYGYLALERNFNGLGDTDAASWAYLERRRMQKLSALGLAKSALSGGRLRVAAASFAKAVGDQFVEWLCDYGESVPRVLGSLLVLHLVFMAIYGLTGSVVRVVETPEGSVRVLTYRLVDLATFSLLALSTSGTPAVGLQPRHESVHFFTATEAIFGIALTGLLGFVIGNRIRR